MLARRLDSNESGSEHDLYGVIDGIADAEHCSLSDARAQELALYEETRPPWVEDDLLAISITRLAALPHTELLGADVFSLPEADEREDTAWNHEEEEGFLAAATAVSATALSLIHI